MIDDIIVGGDFDNLIKSAKFLDREHSSFEVEYYHRDSVVFDNYGSGDEYLWLTTDGPGIADWQPTADDVRAEAQRRMMLLVGARDPKHLEIIISNGLRESIRLLNLGEDNWTADEQATSQRFEQTNIAFDAIRATSNVLEADPPSDFDDDQYWPDFG